MYDDDKDALAAEYVLGTLSADERDHAEARLAIDPEFADVVRQWERRLGELNVMVEAVEPPPAVWERVKAGLGLAGEDTLQLPSFGETAPSSEASGEAQDQASEPFASLLSSSEAELSAEGVKQDTVTDGEPPVAPSAESYAPPPRLIERNAEVIDLAQRLRRWRGISAVAGALAAMLALYVVLTQFAPGILPVWQNSRSQVVAHSQAPAKPQGSRLVAALQQEPIAPAFLVTVDSQSRTLTVRRVSTAADASHSYELWLIPNHSTTPHSLGVVGDEKFTQRPLPANFDIDTMQNASYAVSLEPHGGSPTGAPTGPILFTGKLVDSLPASPPG